MVDQDQFKVLCLCIDSFDEKLFELISECVCCVQDVV